MPSIFEPGGIVQHEYFISGTPVIGFKTGGLKDTIEEYNSTKKTGNGFLFENLDNKEFLNAVNRAVKILIIKMNIRNCAQIVSIVLLM